FLEIFGRLDRRIGAHTGQSFHALNMQLMKDIFAGIPFDLEGCRHVVRSRLGQGILGYLGWTFLNNFSSVVSGIAHCPSPQTHAQDLYPGYLENLPAVHLLAAFNRANGAPIPCWTWIFNRRAATGSMSAGFFQTALTHLRQ